MVKRALSLIAVLALIILAFPIKEKELLTVCLNGKSAGEFTPGSTVTLSELFNADGVSYKLEKDYDYLKLINELDAKRVSEYFDGEIVNLYFYTDKIAKKERAFNGYVNLHVAITSEHVVIGSPIIYYGY